MDLPEDQLHILYNEAGRQRAIDAGFKRIGQNQYEKFLKIHGEYTEGFHRNELEKLKGALRAK